MSSLTLCKRFLVLSLALAAFAFTSLHAQTVAYVSNHGDNTVSVINTATNTVTATISLATPPFGLAVSPDGRRLYAGDYISAPPTESPTTSASTGNGGTVYVIDTSTNTVINAISLPAGAFANLLAITPDGKVLYGTSSAHGDVSVIDIATGTVTATIHGTAYGAIGITPNGATVYASNPYGNTVSAISTAANSVAATIVVGANPALNQLTITPDGAFVYVPNHGANTVSRIATATNTVVGSSIPVGGSPSAAVVTPDGALVYVANTGGNSVSVINVATNTVVGSPIKTSGYGPVFLAVTPDSTSVYLVNQSGSIDVISTATNTIVAKISAVHGPFAIAIARLPSPPTAVAGPNQTITVGQTVHLDGSGSFAPDTLPANLQYAWSFVAQPGGSTAVLEGANKATSGFVADAVGDYVAQLVVTDPATNLASKPSQVVISSIWSPPTANAGAAQSVTTGALVQLSGLGSTDPNGLPLTYAWSFASRPDGSAATITPGANELASFTADVAGPYDVQLVVSDAFGSSQPATALITAITPETAEQLLQDAINFIAAMPAAHFDAGGHRNALSNQLQQAITDIQKNKISQAIGKLNDAIIRTDGFPLRGALDGNGPGMDWITNQSDQKFAYDKLTAVLSMLQPIS